MGGGTGANCEMELGTAVINFGERMFCLSLDTNALRGR